MAADTGLPVEPNDKKVTLHNYKGSVYQLGDYPVVVLNNLSTIFTFNWGGLAQTKYLNKLTQDEPTPTEPDFKYVPWAFNKKLVMDMMERSLVTAVDIETIKMPVEVSRLEEECAAAGHQC